MKVESRDIRQYYTQYIERRKTKQKLLHRKLKQSRQNPETQKTIDTRHRTMTNKTEVTTQKTKTMNEKSRETENIRDKTQSEDKQNRSYNTEN